MFLCLLIFFNLLCLWSLQTVGLFSLLLAESAPSVWSGTSALCRLTGSVQSLSRVQLCDPVNCSTPGLPVHHQLLEFTQTHVHGVSDAIRPSHPLLPPFLVPSVFPSIRVFSSESALPIKWPKYWSFSFCICPFNAYSGFISFRIDWFELFAVKGTLESLFQHHDSKTSVLPHSAFYILSSVQFSRSVVSNSL